MLLILLAASFTVAASDRLLVGEKQRDSSQTNGENIVRHKCLTPQLQQSPNDGQSRVHPWSLPASTSRSAPDTVHCLVLRYNFQFEAVDNPNTTGRGRMNLAQIIDTAAYLSFDSVGHLIDPPPHNTTYYAAQMRALKSYWEKVSRGNVIITWEIFPPEPDSVYELPRPMSFYGRCNFGEVVEGLEQYFVDCIHAADSAHIKRPGHPNINFSRYDAFFLFHAGSDRQNDIGFPETCNDLFTGFIRFGGAVPVDNGTFGVSTALMMPETASQDNRATALNAVLAHEFGHQLGLPDLYSTSGFLSQLGDFELMDNNGFGTGIDFGFPVGNVFGAIPIYPSAWCRAYLGFEEVVDFRKGDDIRLVAAEVVSSGISIARVPISETEYYLIENRIEDIDGEPTAVLADSITNVIQEPVNFNREPTGEYDFLIPGSGVLIFYVDESVAALDYDGDGLDNFQDNQLQIYIPSVGKKFITLVEADGLVNFGGYYRSGFGSENDMFREDRNNSFTPNTNPPSITNTGGNSRIYVTDIRRDSTAGPKIDPIDSVILFDVEIDKLADGFPVRVGWPAFGLSPIYGDLNGDGENEIIAASNNLLSVFTTAGRSFLNAVDSCLTCPPYFDSVESIVFGWNNNNQPDLKPVPLFYRALNTITTNPVIGKLSPGDSTTLSIGFPVDSSSGRVVLLTASDVNDDGRADLTSSFTTIGWPIAQSFGDILWTLTDSGTIYRNEAAVVSLPNSEYYGISRIGERLVLLAGDSAATRFYVIGASVDSFTVGGRYNFGPITVDVNRDGQPEIVAFGNNGEGIYLTVDTSNSNPSFTTLATNRLTKADYSVNPAAGDVDNDGYPDIIIAGRNKIYAFNQELILKSDFPKTIDDRYPDSLAISSPTVADIERGGSPEIIISNESGNVYSYGSERTIGFPLANGDLNDTTGNGSMLIISDSLGGKLGFLGGDGWFYAWNVDSDSTSNYWPMNGHDPAGRFTFDQTTLGSPAVFTVRFPKERFYNYENPVRDGMTIIRYFLGEPANAVSLKIFDLSGFKVAEMSGSTVGGMDHEVPWNCGDITPGIYRCVIEVEFSGDSQSAHTDIAIIR
ncbi:MAG: FG-GAP-like repeat-containing protein [candidate division Zixibacteria bacterium]|nr:FG-GAP-like repeat-containing protein [candidate division Zixibacteria bacterium]